MKSTAVMTAIVLVGSATAGAQETVQPARATTVTLSVSGMQCHLCAGTVERTARQLPGVLDAKASQPDATAEISFDAAKTTPEQIAAALTKRSGFKTKVPSKK